MPTRKRLKLSGPRLAFVTTTVIDWLPVFDNPKVALIAVNQLSEAAHHFGISITAYVLMPSHLHVLIGLPDLVGLSRFMQSYKILTSKRVKTLDLGELDNRLRKEDRFNLWQPRFDDVIITSDKQFRIKMEYIHNNPVKAGLVSTATEYVYSSASDWLEDQPGLVPIDKVFSWTR